WAERGALERPEAAVIARQGRWQLGDRYRSTGVRFRGSHGIEQIRHRTNIAHHQGPAPIPRAAARRPPLDVITTVYRRNMLNLRAATKTICKVTDPASSGRVNDAAQTILPRPCR